MQGVATGPLDPVWQPPVQGRKATSAVPHLQLGLQGANHKLDSHVLAQVGQGHSDDLGGRSLLDTQLWGHHLGSKLDVPDVLGDLLALVGPGQEIPSGPSDPSSPMAEGADPAEEGVQCIQCRGALEEQTPAGGKEVGGWQHGQRQLAAAELTASGLQPLLALSPAQHVLEHLQPAALEGVLPLPAAVPGLVQVASFGPGHATTSRCCSHARPGASSAAGRACSAPSWRAQPASLAAVARFSLVGSDCAP